MARRGRRGRNEGSIRYRESDGRWEATVSVGDGTGRRKSFYGKTRREVAAKLSAALRDLDQGLTLADERQTVVAYLTSWLATIEPTVDQATHLHHASNVRIHLVPAIGGIRLAQLRAQHVAQLYAAKLASGLSPTTVHHLHATLHKALEAAVRLGIVARNVSDLVDAPRIAERELHVLTAEQAKTLLAAVQGHRLEALYVLALVSGMRQMELLGLRWRYVELEAPGGAVLRVAAALKRLKRTHEWAFAEPKTRGSRRTIALAPQTVEVLRRHRARQLQERLFVGEAWRDLDLVFATGDGGPLWPHNVYHQFHRFLATAGLPRIRFHDLRHTCATLLLAARVNPKVVSEQLGHASVAITLDIYSHVLPDMQQDAATALAKVLYG